MPRFSLPWKIILPILTAIGGTAMINYEQFIRTQEKLISVKQEVVEIKQDMNFRLNRLEGFHFRGSNNDTDRSDKSHNAQREATSWTPPLRWAPYLLNPRTP